MGYADSYITDSMILKQGQWYFDNGNVSNFQQLDDMLLAYVLDLSQSQCFVKISLNKQGVPVHAVCDCSGMDECEHIAAVLFHYDSLTSKDNPIVMNKDYFKGKKVFALSTSSIEPFDAMHLIEQFTGYMEIKPAKIQKKRYRLVFVISEGDIYHALDQPFLYPQFSLSLQYIKNNGGLGRITKFKREHLTEPITKREKEFVQQLLDCDSYKNGLRQFVHALVEFKMDNVYVKCGSNYTLLHYRSFARADLHITLRFKYDQILYQPNLMIEMDDGDRHTLTSSDMLVINGGSTFIITQSGLFLFCKTNENLTYFIKSLMKLRFNFKLEDIDLLESHFSKKKYKGISISFDRKPVHVISPVPKVLLELKKNGPDIEVQLLFDYQGKEISKIMEGDFIGSIESTEEAYIGIKRNKNYERKVNAFIHSLQALEVEVRYDSRWLQTDMLLAKDMDTYTFLKEYGRKLIDYGIELRIHKSKQRISRDGKITLKVKDRIDWLDIDVVHEDNQGNTTPVSIDTSMFQHGLVSLGNTYTIVNPNDIATLDRLLTLGFGKNGRLAVSKTNFHIIDELYDSLSNRDEIATLKGIGDKLKDFKKIKSVPNSKGFKGKLRKYQKSGYNWLHFLHQYKLNGCLADDMGLGKTIQTLAFLQSLKESKQLGLSLIIVPVTTMANWEHEIHTFSPKLKHLLYLGNNRTQNIETLKKYDIIIVGYHLLRINIEFFNQMNYDYVILDEAQNIKNSASQTHKAIRALQSQHRLSLTGTPIENNTMELWSQMDFLNPGLLGTRSEFKKRYVIPIEKNKDEQATLQLKKTIFPFILRRKKEDVATDLPEKSEVTLFSEMNESQMTAYTELKEYYRNQLAGKMDADGKNKSSIEIFAALTKLRQMVLFPQLVSNKYTAIESSKFDLLKDTIDEILEEDHKIVIFSQFVETLKIIGTHLNAQQLPYAYIDGSIPAVKRKSEINRFQKDNNVKVFLLSLKAGGVGINLTAADYVILFDPWWNPAAESQAIDRTHRIGQKRNVIAYKMIVKDSIEEKILALQQRKKVLVDNIITTESSFYKSMTKNDILNLFS